MENDARNNRYKIIVSPPKASNYQSISELNVAKIKKMLYFASSSFYDGTQWIFKHDFSHQTFSSILTRFQFALNCRPLYLDEGHYISRQDLIQFRPHLENDAKFAIHPTVVDSLEKCKDELIRGDKFLANVWEQYKLVLIPYLTKLSAKRFGTQEIKVKDVVMMLDNVNDDGGFQLGRVVEVEMGSNGEQKVFKILVIRPSRKVFKEHNHKQSHPFPVNYITTNEKFYLRTKERVILLLSGNFDNLRVFFDVDFVFDGEINEDGMGRQSFLPEPTEADYDSGYTGKIPLHSKEKGSHRKEKGAKNPRVNASKKGKAKRKSKKDNQEVDSAKQVPFHDDQLDASEDDLDDGSADNVANDSGDHNIPDINSFGVDLSSAKLPSGFSDYRLVSLSDLKKLNKKHFIWGFLMELINVEGKGNCLFLAAATALRLQGDDTHGDGRAKLSLILYSQ